MCGIVGYIGSQDATPIIIDGLGRLEYRGYDSAGIAVIHDDAIHLRRDVGKLANLRAKLATSPVSGSIGVGHTRWATHGVPAEHNAHPHISMNGDFVVVHNGIVENYLQLREELMAEGVTFKSETDTEVIVQLIERFAKNGANYNLAEATRKAVKMLRGAHAIVVMSIHTPDELIAVRIGNAGGVALGLGDGATGADVRRAYKRLVRRYHPDSNGGDRAQEGKLQAVVNAYTHLKSAPAFQSES